MTPDRLRAALRDRYTIERELGQGGMATVYLAHDIKHDRDVAIKVLKPELAAVIGAERFVVEIKTTAALQHPHILPLFDSGTADSFLYYVMPYIQGETIREKLNRETQFGVEEAVRITRDVADALDYAHRNGVIHRDIKPENIMLHDGRPTVMDFGIALALSAAAGGRMTETGMSLGTPHYMSPEQATADKEITGRSDIYSLGAVLYEMLAGQPPHLGGSAQQIIMKIIAEPTQPVTVLRKSVPGNVAAALSKALEKLPADRFDTAKAFRDALADEHFTVAAQRITSSGGRRASRGALIGGMAIVGALCFGAAWLVRGGPSAAQPVTQYRVALAPGRTLAGTPWSRLTVSPDGSRLVYLGNSVRGTQLFVRKQDELDGTPIPGTEGAINPAFAPSGDSVAFMNGRTIQIVSLTGGALRLATDSLVGLPGVAWGSDGYIYYDHLGVGPLMRVRAAAGGKAESIGQLDSIRGEVQHVWPDVLPNGKGVILTAMHGGPGVGGDEQDEIAVLDLATGKHRSLFRGVFARYARSGHLIYVTANGTLMGIAFNQDRMESSGEPVKLAEGLAIRTGAGAVDLTISATGTLWFVSGGISALNSYEVISTGRDGSGVRVVEGLAGLTTDPVIAPDGNRLAVSGRGEAGAHILIKDLDVGTLGKLMVNSASSPRPAWTADGKSIAYLAGDVPHREVQERLAVGGQPSKTVLTDKRTIEEVIFSPDGQWMVYRGGLTRGELRLFARRIGTDSSLALFKTEADVTSPALSPDGHWLAYVSRESSTPEVYVSPFPNTTVVGRVQISAAGGQEPVWAHSGRELFYRSLGTTTDSQMVMQVKTGPAFVPGPRRALFPLVRIAESFAHQQYAVTHDDMHFIMIRYPEAEQAVQLSVIENVFGLLRAGVGKK